MIRPTSYRFSFLQEGNRTGSLQTLDATISRSAGRGNATLEEFERDVRDVDRRRTWRKRNRQPSSGRPLRGTRAWESSRSGKMEDVPMQWRYYSDRRPRRAAGFDRLDGRAIANRKIRRRRPTTGRLTGISALRFYLDRVQTLGAARSLG